MVRRDSTHTCGGGCGGGYSLGRMKLGENRMDVRDRIGKDGVDELLLGMMLGTKMEWGQMEWNGERGNGMEGGMISK